MMTLSRCDWSKKTCTKITFNVTCSQAPPCFNDSPLVGREKSGHQANLASHEYPQGDVMIARLIMCECTVKTELV